MLAPHLQQTALRMRQHRVVLCLQDTTELEAALFFTREEWEAAYILGKKPVPKTMPRVRDVIRQIAKLGGFLGRKCDGEPGVKILWIGLQRVRDFVLGMEFMRKAHAR